MNAAFRFTPLSMLLMCGTAAVLWCWPTLSLSGMAQENVAAKPLRDHEIVSVVTPYDIMTAEDEFYYHHIYKLTDDADVANWPLVKSLLGLGGNFFDARELARLANQSIKINEQQRAVKIMEMVKECSQTLGVDPPPVFIQGSAVPNAYVTNLTHPHVLVLTSGLIEIYQDEPAELKFIIGHELGHLKAQHIRTHLVGRMLQIAMLGRTQPEAGSVKDLVAIATAGILMHWYRESEYSADRAGLLCVQGDLKVAQQSLLRLLHQTRQTNKMMNEEEKIFSAPLAKEDQTELRNRPFVHIFSFVTEFQSTHPFVPQRCEQLAQWRGSAEFEEITSRADASKTVIFVDKIEIESLPHTDVTIPLIDGTEPDPYLELSYAEEQQHTAMISDNASPIWDAPKLNFTAVDGAGLIIDVFDKNSVTSNNLLGSVRVDIQPRDVGEFQVEADLRLDVLQESTIVDRPRVKVHYRVVAR
jgi:Zn-dependent protease with chaperone function